MEGRKFRSGKEAFDDKLERRAAKRRRRAADMDPIERLEADLLGEDVSLDMGCSGVCENTSNHWALQVCACVSLNATATGSALG